MTNKQKQLLLTLQKLKKNQIAISKAISSLEVLIGSDAFYDSDLGSSIASLTEATYDAVETAYGLPCGDLEWLESKGWFNKGKESLYTQGRGVVLVDSLERYVEVACGD
jgi:hypothetical protein